MRATVRAAFLRGTRICKMVVAARLKTPGRQSLAARFSDPNVPPKRRIDIIEIMDQWYGPGYRYVKVRAYDSSVYILLFDEIGDHWKLIMFCAAPAQGWQDLARSALSRQ
jgi:hypothetical protein